MKKILFIEDEALLNSIYQKQFGAKYTCFFATTGQEGINLAIKERPDLIVLDIILPGNKNGFDVLRELKQNQLTKDITVIVLTNLEDEKDSAKAAGAADSFVKANTDIAHIEKIINQYLA